MLTTGVNSPMAEVPIIDIKLSARTKPGEYVAVVGEPRELGSWNFEKALALRGSAADPTAANNGTWTGRLQLGTASTARVTLRYRYFIYRRLLSTSGKKVRSVVVDWESAPEPRTRSIQLPFFQDHDSNEKMVLKDTYGYFDDKPMSTSRGWLCDSTVVQIQLHLPELPVISDVEAICLPRSGAVTWRVRCQPCMYSTTSIADREDMQVLNGNVTEDWNDSSLSPSWTTVSVLGSFTDQEQTSSCGLPLLLSSYMIFKTYVDNPASLAFRLEFYLGAAEQGDELTDGIHHVTPACHAYLLPEQMRDCDCGFLICPLQDSGRLVGTIRVNYLLAKPCVREDMRHNMKTGCEVPLLWKRGQQSEVRWQALTALPYSGVADPTSTLLVGHRGCGSTPAKGIVSTGERDSVYENTLASFLKAHAYGADFVELDVHLTADKQVVVYHDFVVPVLLQAHGHGKINADAGSVRYKIAVNELTADNLQTVCDIMAREGGSGTAVWVERPQLFPLLADILRSISVEAGVVVEIKYPQLMKSGLLEEPVCANVVDRNEFVDHVIAVLLRHAVVETEAPDGSVVRRRRQVALACFDADICALARLKQAVFPVFFLTMGMTKQWDLYADSRTHLVETAIHFASSQALHGVSVNSEDYIYDTSSLPKAHDAGLAFWTWGNECNDPLVFNRLRSHGADAIIYDRIGDLQ